MMLLLMHAAPTSGSNWSERALQEWSGFSISLLCPLRGGTLVKVADIALPLSRSQLISNADGKAEDSGASLSFRALNAC